MGMMPRVWLGWRKVENSAQRRTEAVHVVVNRSNGTLGYEHNMMTINGTGQTWNRNKTVMANDNGKSARILVYINVPVSRLYFDEFAVCNMYKQWRN